MGYERGSRESRAINLMRFSKAHQKEMIEAINRYYGRHLAAVEYQEQKNNGTPPSPTS